MVNIRATVKKQSDDIRMSRCRGPDERIPITSYRHIRIGTTIQQSSNNIYMTSASRADEWTAVARNGGIHIGTRPDKFVHFTKTSTLSCFEQTTIDGADIRSL